jgi:hypothetical protein
MHLRADECASREHRILRERAHDGDKLLGVEGLADVRRRARAESGDAVRRQPARGQQHHRSAA